MARLIVAGEVCVEIRVPAHEVPPPGGFSMVPALTPRIGGCAVNTAVTARRLGVSTALAGVMGDDIFGQLVRDRLLREKVDTTRLKMVTGRSSPTALIYESANNLRSSVYHAGTNSDFRFPELALKAPCQVFHFAAPEVLENIWPRRAVDVFRRLKAARRTVSLDPAVKSACRSGERHIVEEYRHLLELVDLAFPDEEEAVLISGRKELKSVFNYFHERGVQIVVIKRGEKGAVVSSQGRTVNVKTSRVKVVDTVGAGAAFTAGFLAGHIRGLDPVQCTRLACSLGTLSVAHKGPFAATDDAAWVEGIRSQLEHVR